MRLALLILASLFVGEPLVWARSFPEEKTRAKWDLGCQDWPVSLSTRSASFLGQARQKNPEIHAFKKDGFLRVFAHMRVAAAKGESMESLEESLSGLLMDAFAYPRWVLPGVNESPNGEKYFVSLDGLGVREVKENTHFVLHGPFTFQLLWFKRQGTSGIELRLDEANAPDCAFFRQYPIANGSKLKKLVYRMIPRPELIKMLMAEVYVLPLKEKKQIDLRMRLVGEPSTLVYQLLPEAMLKGQVEQRGRRIFQNLLELRRSESVAGGPKKKNASSLDSEKESSQAPEAANAKVQPGAS